MGNTCTPMADSCQYMTKPIQYWKAKKKKKKKRKEKKEGKNKNKIIKENNECIYYFL